MDWDKKNNFNDFYNVFEVVLIFKDNFLLKVKIRNCGFNGNFFGYMNFYFLLF